MLRVAKKNSGLKGPWTIFAGVATPASEMAYGDILSYGQNIGVQHDVRPLRTYAWDRKWKNGLFTYSLLNGLKNHQADTNKDRVIAVSELQAYVIE